MKTTDKKCLFHKLFHALMYPNIKAVILLEVTPDIDVDNLDAQNYLNNLDRQGIESKFVFKMYDAQEQIQLNRWKQENAPSYHKTTKTYTYHFEDVLHLYLQKKIKIIISTV